MKRVVVAFILFCVVYTVNIFSQGQVGILPANGVTYNVYQSITGVISAKDVQYVWLVISKMVSTDTLFVMGGNNLSYLAPLAIKDMYAPAEWDSVITGVTAIETEATNRAFYVFAPGGLNYLKLYNGITSGEIIYRIDYRF